MRKTVWAIFKTVLKNTLGAAKMKKMALITQNQSWKEQKQKQKEKDLNSKKMSLKLKIHLKKQTQGLQKVYVEKTWWHEQNTFQAWKDSTVWEISKNMEEKHDGWDGKTFTGDLYSLVELLLIKLLEISLQLER